MAGSAHVPYGPGLTEMGPIETTDKVVLEFWNERALEVLKKWWRVGGGGRGVEDSSGTNLS